MSQSMNDDESSNLRKFLPSPQSIKHCQQRLHQGSSLDLPASFRSLGEDLFANLGDAVTVRWSDENSVSEATLATTFLTLAAKSNSWSRSARRAGSSKTEPPSESIPLVVDPSPPEPPTLPITSRENLLEANFSISVVRGDDQRDRSGEGRRREDQVDGLVVELRGEWVRGLDFDGAGTAWESLWGVLKRRLREVVAARGVQGGAVPGKVLGSTSRKRRKVE